MLMAGEGVFLEGVALLTGPARLAWMVEPKTCEPVLGVCVDVDASESPGRAKLGTAIAIGCGDAFASGVVAFVDCQSCLKQFWMLAPAFVRFHDLTAQRQGATYTYQKCPSLSQLWTCSLWKKVVEKST